MIAPSLPKNETERLRSLRELAILDTLEEQSYDDLTLLAAQICNTPIALISLIDHDRQWFKSHLGLAARETPRELAICAHAIHQDEVFVVEDATRDPRFHDNPLVTGDPHVIFYAGAPLTMSEGIRVGTLCVISDHPRKLSNAQQQALEALARQVVAQLEMRLRVKELLALEQAKDEFIATVSHEMRTPLTAINGSLSLLQNQVTGQLEPDSQRMVDVAQRNATRLLDIVNDILDLAKIRAGKLSLDMHRHNLIDVVEQAVILNQPLVEDHHSTLELRRPEDNAPILVNCDQFRITQVLTNFISNAAKYTSAPDNIIVSLHPTATWVCVEVEDHGPGIAEAKRELLFKRFSQLNSSANYKNPGTGLGLNISQQLVEMHHGRIGFHSEPGLRTGFHFSLPRVVD